MSVPKITPTELYNAGLSSMPDEINEQAATVKQKVDGCGTLAAERLNDLIDDVDSEVQRIDGEINRIDSTYMPIADLGDYIVESGGTADSTYIKYNSGLMIQTKRVSISTAVATASGNIFIHSATQLSLGSFAEAWDTSVITPMITVTVRNSGGGPGMWLSMNYSAIGTIGSAFICSATSYATANIIRVEAIGIGRWK